MRRHRTSRSSIKRAFTSAGLAGLLAFTGLALPTEAEARPKRGHGYQRGHHGNPHRAQARHFAIPRHLGDHARFRPFFAGRFWFGPHRHHHAVYRFPVRSAYGHTYHRPYAYCNGNLYGGFGFSLDTPRFSLDYQRGGGDRYDRRYDDRYDRDRNWDRRRRYDDDSSD